MDIEQAINCGDLISRSARFFPHKVALFSGDNRITYSELNKRINSLSNALIDMGVRKGDHVAVFFPNSVHFIEAYLATSKAGAVVVPLNFRLAPRELIYQIDNADCMTLIYSAAFKDTIDSIRPQLPKIKNYICDGEALPQGVFNHDELIAKYPDSEPDVEVGGEDGCVIIYTAGTTGLPKGAYRTHLNQLWATVDHILMMDIMHDDILLGLLPYFHHAGWLAYPLATFMRGATLIIGGEKAFNPVEMLETIQREKVTNVLLVPTMCEAMSGVSDIGKYDLSSLRVFLNAAGTLRAETKEWLAKILPPHTKFLTNAYGQSEGPWIACASPERVEKYEAAGITRPIIRVRLVDEERMEVPQGEIGEIVLQGPGVFKGYYKEPKKTASTIVNNWLHTGDQGRFDEEGYLYIVGRVKDMVKSRGENVYAAEVEFVLLQHPKVREAAMIGLPDEKWGELVTAVVVLKPGEEATEQEVTDFCRGEMAHYKAPKRVIFTDAIPKSFKGEIIKRELREKYAKKV